ncbi:MAG: PilZ domain-containing protein [Thermodesulfobacteriota bacterium]
MTSPGGAPTDSSRHGYTPVRRLPKPFSAEALISLFQDIYDPLEYRRTVRVHPPDGVRVEIKSGNDILTGKINDISLGGLSCSTAVIAGLNIYSTATLTIAWDDVEPGSKTTGRSTVEGEAIRFEAMEQHGNEEKQCIVAFRFIKRRGDDTAFLTEKISSLIDATSREIG